jgi:hypothetical protein
MRNYSKTCEKYCLILVYANFCTSPGESLINEAYSSVLDWATSFPEKMNEFYLLNVCHES